MRGRCWTNGPLSGRTSGFERESRKGSGRGSNKGWSKGSREVARKVSRMSGRCCGAWRHRVSARTPRSGCRKRWPWLASRTRSAWPRWANGSSVARPDRSVCCRTAPAVPAALLGFAAGVIVAGMVTRPIHTTMGPARCPRQRAAPAPGCEPVVSVASRSSSDDPRIVPATGSSVVGFNPSLQAHFSLDKAGCRLMGICVLTSPCVPSRRVGRSAQKRHENGCRNPPEQ